MTGLPARQRAVEGALRPHVNAVLCWFGNSERGMSVRSFAQNVSSFILRAKNCVPVDMVIHILSPVFEPSNWCTRHRCYLGRGVGVHGRPTGGEFCEVSTASSR